MKCVSIAYNIVIFNLQICSLIWIKIFYSNCINIFIAIVLFIFFRFWYIKYNIIIYRGITRRTKTKLKFVFSILTINSNSEYCFVSITYSFFCNCAVTKSDATNCNTSNCKSICFLVANKDSTIAINLKFACINSEFWIQHCVAVKCGIRICCGLFEFIIKTPISKFITTSNFNGR